MTRVVIDTDELDRLARSAATAAAEVGRLNRELAAAWVRNRQARPELVRLMADGTHIGGRLVALSVQYDAKRLELTLERAQVLLREGVESALVVPYQTWKDFRASAMRELDELRAEAGEQLSAFQDAAMEELEQIRTEIDERVDAFTTAVAAEVDLITDNAQKTADHLQQVVGGDPLRIMVEPGVVLLESAGVGVGGYLGAKGKDKITIPLAGQGSLSFTATGGYNLDLSGVGVVVMADPKSGEYRRTVAGVGVFKDEEGTYGVVIEPPVFKRGKLGVSGGPTITYNPKTHEAGYKVSATAGYDDKGTIGLHYGGKVDIDDRKAQAFGGSDVNVLGIFEKSETVTVDSQERTVTHQSKAKVELPHGGGKVEAEVTTTYDHDTRVVTQKTDASGEGPLGLASGTYEQETTVNTKTGEVTSTSDSDRELSDDPVGDVVDGIVDAVIGTETAK